MEITFKELKNREQEILSYLKSNTAIFFITNIYNQNEVHESSLALNYNLQFIEVNCIDMEREWGGRTNPFFEEGCKEQQSPVWWMCYDEDMLEDNELLTKELYDSIRYYIANEYAKKGYSHKQVLWALHNCENELLTIKQSY